MKDWYHQNEDEGVSEAVPKRKGGEPIERGTWVIAGAILLGSLIISAGILSSPGSFERPTSGTNDTLPSADTAAAPDDEPSGPVKVSVDDDPVLGDKNAPLTLIEFSDYECPFCKRSFTDVLPELKKAYIDTGKVKFVYRDLPLSFHANAQKEAEAAECARSLGNDATYFKFHDQIFSQTTSNGTGLALSQLPVIAKGLGLNTAQFEQCLDSGKFKEEVEKDVADAGAIGISGTPSWVVGATSADGTIEGQLIVGAQPFNALKTIIDEKLNAK